MRVWVQPHGTSFPTIYQSVMYIPVAVVSNDPATGITPLEVGHQVLVLNIHPARQQHALTDGAVLNRLRGQDLEFGRPQYQFCQQTSHHSYELHSTCFNVKMCLSYYPSAPFNTSKF